MTVPQLADDVMVLTPALSSPQLPEWDGAIWVGQIDLDEIAGFSAVRLERADGYSRARLLVRRNRALLGFIEVDVAASRIDCETIQHAVTTLASAPGGTAGGRENPCPPVTVVVCTRDRVEMLAEALTSILALDYPDFEVVVVDNASNTDATVRYVETLADPRVRLVSEPLPGLSRARNTGVRAATTEIIAFTDDDVVVDPDWLRGLANGFGSGERVACVCGIVPSGEIRTPAQAYFDQRVGWASSCTPRLFDMAAPPKDVPLFPFQVGIYGTGANFAVVRTAVLELGGFDEALGAGAPTNGGEDLDMFFRILTGRHQLAYEPAAIVWHRHRADNDALAVQARGYGLGLGAWMAKVLINPKTAWLALSVVLRKAPAFARLAYRMSKVATPPNNLGAELPTGIGRTELLSIAKGPGAYLAARREGRRSAPLTSAPLRGAR